MVIRNSFTVLLLFTLILILTGCKSENDKAVVNLVFSLNSISETDSTVTMRLNFGSKKRYLTENGGEFNPNINEMLVSIIPINGDSLNFVETVLRGNALTEIEAIAYPTGPLNPNSRGMIIPALHTRDSVFVSFTFVIKKGINYLFYSTFQKPCILDDDIQTRYKLTIRQNENIEPKLVATEFANLQQLMKTAFPPTNSEEVTNLCFQITDSYTFYRDRPVKLLYYP